ncbi:MAG TPA: hypothetical protein VGX76_19430 [Pirellulales bacterium]|jgi:hypothetical protein|nr:hypothetical protein [Pirellulales bacterium]
MRTLNLALAGCLAVACCVSAASQASAGTYLFGFSSGNSNQLLVDSTTGSFAFSTADNQLTGGANNQGWWSGTVTNVTGNDNYIVGVPDGNHQLNNYFTFNLAGLTGNVLGARLVVGQGTGSGAAGAGPAIDVCYSLYDVSTRPTTLSDESASWNGTIYNDLGSGSNFGSFSLNTGSSGGTDTLALNSAGLAAINGAEGGFFSIGGSLNLASVPEPASLAIWGLSVLGLACHRRSAVRRRSGPC